MQMNKAKYWILFLIALFLVSTNELSAKEAEQNYNSESHNFIEIVSYTSQDSFNFNLTARYFSSVAFVDNHDCNYSGNLLSDFALNFFFPSFKPKIYLDISILRI